MRLTIQIVAADHHTAKVNKTMAGYLTLAARPIVDTGIQYNESQGCWYAAVSLVWNSYCTSSMLSTFFNQQGIHFENYIGASSICYIPARRKNVSHLPPIRKQLFCLVEQLSAFPGQPVYA